MRTIIQRTSRHGFVLAGDTGLIAATGLVGVVVVVYAIKSVGCWFGFVTNQYAEHDALDLATSLIAALFLGGASIFFSGLLVERLRDNPSGHPSKMTPFARLFRCACSVASAINVGDIVLQLINPDRVLP